jgi:8-oxo-dGTP diphosphatase
MLVPKGKLLRATLTFLIREERGVREILLARKMRKTAEGFLNGYGGMIEEIDTSPAQSAKRELLEEARLIALAADFKKKAIIRFHNITKEGIEFDCEVHVFVLTKWRGKPKSTTEMKNPSWYLCKEIPYEKMAPSDISWLPKILAGEKFFAEVWLGPGQKELLKPVIFREVCPEEKDPFENDN